MENPGNGEIAVLDHRQAPPRSAVTPSDVGRLNRLVIPKQHAEKHFPLQVGTIAGGGGGVVLLSFEDCQSGKVWRFRYSYWNSSQSYVLTKGWNRFVKEKGIAPGDIISFLRAPLPADKETRWQLYIDWKPHNRVGASQSHGGGGGSRSGKKLPLKNVIPCSGQAVHRLPAVRLFGVNILRASPEEVGGD